MTEKKNKVSKNSTLPKGWRKVKLGEILSNKPQYGYTASAEFNKIGPKFLRVTDIVKSKFSWNKLPYCGIPKKKIKQYILEKDDIVFARAGSVGFTYYISEKPPEDTIFASYLIRIRLNKSKCYPKYLAYFLKSPFYWGQVNGFLSGSVQQGINATSLQNFEIFIPEDINEQKRIADILSAFDEKIELNNKINQTLEQIAQAIFKEWFVKSGKSKVKVKKLSNLVETQYGYTETASNKKIGPKFLRVKDINKTEWIAWNEVPYCKISKENFEKYKLKEGDIVIARMANPGKVGIIEQKIEAVFASYLIRLKIKSDKIKPYYLYYYLKSPLYQNFISRASTGTTRKSANAKVLTDCEIAIPQKDRLEKFKKVAKEFREKINFNLIENQKLAAIRDLLLPKLMSGEIRV